MRHLLIIKIIIVMCAGMFCIELSAKQLRFNWPVPGKIMVQERSIKKGQQAIMNYTLSITGNKTGSRVKFTDFKLLSVQGVDATDPAIKNTMGPGLETISYLPVIRLDANGKMEGVAGMDTIKKKIMAAGKKNPLLIKAINSPRFNEILKSKVSLYWDTWVGTWIGRDLVKGQSKEVKREVSVFGVPFKVKGTVTYIGPDPKKPAKIRLKYKSVLEGPDVARKLVNGIAQLSKQAGKRSPIPADYFVYVTRNSSIKIITDPNTMVPENAISQIKIDFTTKDGKTYSYTESHEFKFQ